MHFLAILLTASSLFFSTESFGVAPTCAEVNEALELCEKEIRDYQSRVNAVNAESTRFERSNNAQIEQMYKTDPRAAEELDRSNNRARNSGLREAKISFGERYQSLMLRKESFAVAAIGGGSSLQYCRGSENALGLFESCMSRAEAINRENNSSTGSRNTTPSPSASQQ